MDISITGVTAQRKFGKTCVRLRWFLDELRHCCDDADTTSERFDILQLTFMDRPEAFLHSEKPRSGSRLHQFQVGMGLERDFSPQQDRSFLVLVAAQAMRAVHQAPLSSELRQDALARIERWKDSIEERLDDAQNPKA
jgi:hypothetical protein